jgi:pimeloyl-ACP methyl ester carboxylesterase
VGHSLGGGVAMQLAYQFPDRCDRLVLVASGGLGREVTPLLRAAALPGAEYVLPLICGLGLASVGDAVAGVLGKLGLRAAPDLEEMWRGYASLSDASARQAFVHTLRGIIDPGGQRVSAADRLYLAVAMPTIVIWGDRDHIIPSRHAHVVRGAVPNARLEIFDGARHYPHRDDPHRFVEVLCDFIASTPPADLAEAGWREMLIAGG